MDLVSDYSDKGYTLFMDNYYSSPELFHDLVKSGFHACGTVRCDRRGIKQTFKDKVLSTGKPFIITLCIDIQVNTGEVYSEITETGILCLKWKDKRDVCMLSTFHDDTMIDKNRRRKGVAGMETIRKPKVVEEYNQSMNGVDRSDQMVLYYGYSHRYFKSLLIITAKITLFCRAMKWWKRIFYHLLDLSLVNANILYNEASPKPLHHMDFRLAVAKSLLENHAGSTYFQSVNNDLPLRLTSRCFPERIPKNTQYAGHHQCVVCGAKRKRSQTRYRCKTCQVALHIEDCFEVFHTKRDYTK